MATPLGITIPKSLMQSGSATNLGSLGQTAAQQVKAENHTAALTASKAKADKPASGWTIPDLSHFKLDPALNRAQSIAYNHLDNLLSPDGMHIKMQQPVAENVTEGMEEKDIHAQVTVHENGSDKPLKTYSEQAILQLYAHNQHRSSIVVDGKV